MSGAAFLRAVPASDPETSPETTKTDPQQDWLEAFDADFWPIYPRKIARHAARKEWLRIKPWTQETCNDIFAGLHRYLTYWEEQGTEKEYIPHARTWLHQRRWEDEP